MAGSKPLKYANKLLRVCFMTHEKRKINVMSFIYSETSKHSRNYGSENFESFT